MATFYVGQRVRLVRPAHAENMGKEGRIKRFDFFPRGAIGSDLKVLPFDCDCVVDWDTYSAMQCTDQLEPIIPEGHKASEYTYSELMDLLRSGVTA